MDDANAIQGVPCVDADAVGQELPPTAPLLMHSLRAMGYTTAAAVADLVDNSLAAHARTVRISFRPVPEPFVAIVDDGEGMDEQTLVEAMRFGSRDPRSFRAPNDLGRFGLGLKTASLSQCRRLTVASMKNGNLSAARWDLDRCDQTRSWWLERPRPDSVRPELITTLEAQGHGTAVIWEKLDRLLESGTGASPEGLDAAMEGAADQLALSFHRFLSGEMTGGFQILLNDRPLPVLDPFLEGHVRGQALHGESFPVEGQLVTVSPFVLPFPSRLGEGELTRAGGRERIKTAHGFYIYRGGRLVVPGGWFRIVPSDELTRLARIRVDVPVELDHIWKIDVRKTTVEPPAALRPHLKRIVGEVTTRSRRVYTFRGTPVSKDIVPLWARHELRDGAAAWRINRDHPLVNALTIGAVPAQQVEHVLELLEQSLPIHDIHIHVSNDLPVAEPRDSNEAELETLARRLVEAFAGSPEIISKLLERLPVTEPFNRAPEAAYRIVERLRQ